MVSVAASGNTSWVCDHSLELYALDQPEILRSPDYRHKCHAPFKWAPTVYQTESIQKKSTLEQHSTKTTCVKL